MKKGVLIFSFILITILLVSSVYAFSWNGFWAKITGKAIDNTITCNPGQKIGDVNGDGLINNDDADIVLKISSELIPIPEDICCADVNKDGTINPPDATKILRIAAGLEESPGVCTNNCTANCIRKQCGDDGCGGICGLCLPGYTCNANNQCAYSGCTPNCAGKSCGDDGCGGSCGTCNINQTCSDGNCVNNCVPNCIGKQCGDNECGGSCGSCNSGQDCANGVCINNQNIFNNFKAENPGFYGDTSIKLSWVNPNINLISSYTILYSTDNIKENASISYSATLNPGHSGENMIFLVQNLKPNTNYYFWIKVMQQDETYVWSNFTTGKTLPAYTGKSTVAIFVNKDVYNNIELKQDVDRYSVDIKNTLGNINTQLVLFDSNYSEKNLVDNLKNIYETNRLEGAVFIGGIPKPYLFNGDMNVTSVFPYEDLENILYVYNETTKNFENPSLLENGRFPLSKPEIWVGFINPPASGDEGITLLKNFFDKDHAYHTGQLSFDKKVFYDNQIDGPLYEEIQNFNSTGRWNSSNIIIMRQPILNDTPGSDAPYYVSWKKEYINNLTKNSYELVYLYTHGDFDMGSNHQYYVLYNDIKEIHSNISLFAVFSCLCGADFTLDTHILNWYVFSGALSAQCQSWYLFDHPNSIGYIHYFANGTSLGRSILKTAQETNNYGGYMRDSSYILGDPTISLKISANNSSLINKSSSESSSFFALIKKFINKINIIKR